RVPEVKSAHRYIQSAGLRQAGNTPIQGTGADIIRLDMAEVEDNLVEMYREGIWCWPLLTTHDDLMVEVEEEYAEFTRDMMSSVMSNVMQDKQTDDYLYRVPLT